MTVHGVSSGHVQSIGDGRFECDGEKMSFEDLAFMVQMESVNRVDEQFASKFSEVKQRNQDIKRINDMLSRLKGYESRYSGTDDNHVEKLTPEDQKVWKDFLKDYVDTGIINDSGTGSHSIWGIGNDYIFNHQELETVIESCKSAVSNMNSENELDMMTLNKLGNQRNSYMQLLKSLLEKVSQARGDAARL